VVGAVGVEGSAAFFGPLRRLFRGFLVLLALAAVVVVAMALVTERGLRAPLTRLMQAALRIGRGDLSTPVPPEKVRELGILAQELEAMRRALEGRDAQLKMMLAGVAHEVRNPIGGIELFAGLLAEELASAPSGDAAAHVGRIRREIDYLKRIVEDFLNFAREQKLSFAEAQSDALLSSVKDLLSSDAEKKQIDVVVQAEPAALQLDVALVTAALVNLLKNAVQASPEKGAVSVTGAREGTGYRIFVEDTGGGIAPELQERIFEPFFTTREKGTGLGLPLARKIAQAHGGELLVESRPGMTRFTLTLPLREGSL
jgi:signal transduction histidine kinase